MYRHIKNEGTLLDLKRSSKSYKNIIKSSVNKYKKAFNNKLRLLKVSNSRDYWKILCSGDKKETVIKIQTEVLTEFFKELNIDKNVYDECELINGNSNADEYTVNQLLNVEFNEKEISDVKKLKNNKANGVDLVINEFIKCTFDKM